MVIFVEAIEEGKIVKVTEDYAKREGLLIIRKQNDTVVYDYAPEKKETFTRKNEDKRLRKDFTLNKMRKPLNYYKNNIVNDLIDNFHWEIIKARKIKNVTRKQVAQSINESEETVKMIENGILQEDNYILVNKIQSYFGINLRKDGKNFTAPLVLRKPETKMLYVPKDKTEEPDIKDIDLEEKEIEISEEKPVEEDRKT
ncbi:MAG: hypothetical protein Q8L29_04505 [archaeon]|nr:hypothetical protein [archaeon]